MNEIKHIGILTWTQYHNYGTQLQAYALYTAVSAMGYDTRLIDYRPSAAASIGNIIMYHMPMRVLLGKLRNKALGVINGHNSQAEKTRNKRIRAFLEANTRLTDEVRDMAALTAVPGDMDAIICGSDQIWNPAFFDPAYFLSFAGEKIRRLAYAPSFGVNMIPRRKKRLLADYISKFDALSVRELRGAELVLELTGREAEVVSDPVLLLGRKHWDNIIHAPSVGRGYVLCYMLENHDTLEYARREAEHIASEIYLIERSCRDAELSGVQIIADASPDEFIGWVGSAQKIVTDSYHGLLFALVYNKPVTVFKRFSENDIYSQNSRIESLLQILGVEAAGSVITIEKEQYASINPILEHLRERSINWLEDALLKEEKLNAK